MKTAIVTGACSGMGLALTRHLLEKNDLDGQKAWRVVLADLNEESYERLASTFDADRHIFISCDVSRWSQQTNLFKRAYEWSGGRIDFFANNAGIDDLHLRRVAPDVEEPVEPDLKVLAVDLHAVFYAVELFVFYTRKTRHANIHKEYQPKFVITASASAQYPFFIIPQYTAAKHGCLGYVRAISPRLWKHEGIALNCIMPGFVDTGIIPPGIAEQWPQEARTPIEVICRAFDELISVDGHIDQTTQSSDGEDGVVKWGCAIEASGNKLYYRAPVDFADETQRWVFDQSKEDGILGKAAAQILAQPK